MMDPGQASRAACIALSYLALCAACTALDAERPLVLGVGPSVLPNLGVSASAAVGVGEIRSASLWLETELTQQCLDDSDVTNDPHAAAGDWTQLRLGGKLAIASTESRDWTVRAGFVLAEARGKPNIVQDAGDYYGSYLGLGFESALSEHVSAGPELALLTTVRDGGSHLHFVPQLTWRILFRW